VVTAGWPVGLVPESADDFVDRAVSWLLDQAPADLRTSVVRAYPRALAYLVWLHVGAQTEATRDAYRTIRAELGRQLGPEALGVVQQGLEAEGARLLRLSREVDLVRSAIDRQAGRNQ